MLEIIELRLCKAELNILMASANDDAVCLIWEVNSVIIEIGFDYG